MDYLLPPTYQPPGSRCGYRARVGGQRCGESTRGKVRDLGEAFGALRRQTVCDRHASQLADRPARTVPPPDDQKV